MSFSEKRLFSYGNITRVPDDHFGIYMIWRKKRCIYVGESTEQSLRTRLMNHYNNCHNPCLKDWIKSSFPLMFSYKVGTDKKLTKEEEKVLIKRMKTDCNKKDNV